MSCQPSEITEKADLRKTCKKKNKQKIIFHITDLPPPPEMTDQQCYTFTKSSAVWLNAPAWIQTFASFPSLQISAALHICSISAASSSFTAKDFGFCWLTGEVNTTFSQSKAATEAVIDIFCAKVYSIRRLLPVTLHPVWILFPVFIMNEKYWNVYLLWFTKVKLIYHLNIVFCF